MTGAYTAKDRLLASMAKHGITKREIANQMIEDGYSVAAAELLAEDFASGRQCTVGTACALISVIVKQGRAVRN